MPERRIEDRRKQAGHPPTEVERRKTVRRFLAGAGLVATLAAAAPRAANYIRSPGTGNVEVSTADFRLPKYDPALVEAVIREAAAAYGVRPELVRAVIQTESAFNPLAVSPVGAQGLMQLMPVTAAYLGVQDAFDPRQNIHGGVKYLSMLLDRFKGNTALALAGYNAGPTAVARHRGIPPFGETRGYVKKIRGLVADTHSAFSIPEPRRPKKALLRLRKGAGRSQVRLARLKATRGSGNRSGALVRRVKNTRLGKARAVTAGRASSRHKVANSRGTRGRSYRAIPAKASRRVRTRTSRA